MVAARGENTAVVRSLGRARRHAYIGPMREVTAMQVRLNIDDAFMRDIQDKVGAQTGVAELAKDAFAVLRWAIDEVARGRVVLSADCRGCELQRLVMPTLTRVEARARAAEHG